MNQEVMKKSNMRSKIIKRYQNRKLYDTQQSCYVTLDDIAKMIRANEDVTVIDNKTKNDITAATLTQIIFEAEKKASQYAPLFTLREVIQNGNGSISSYLAKLGAFPADYVEKQAKAKAEAEAANKAVAVEVKKSSFEDIKQSLEERVASAANAAPGIPTLESNNPGFNSKPQAVEPQTPSLPNSNKGFNNI